MSYNAENSFHRSQKSNHTMPGFLTTMLQLLVILLVCVAATNGSSQCPVTSAKKLKPLHILTLLPIPKRRSQFAQGSFSHIAGARVALREINRRKDFLPGYRLEMIVESTGRRCAFSPLQLTSTGLDTMVKYTVNPPCPPLVAVNGLSCTLQTSFISYVAKKDRFDLIHFATKRLRSVSDETDFTRLWRIVDSGAVYVDALLSIMDKFDWNRIAIVFDRSRQFLRIISTLIRARVLNSPNKEVLFTAPIRNVYREEKYEEIVQLLKKRAGRVLVIALTPKKSAELLCRLAKDGLVYPVFTAILVDDQKMLNLTKEVQCNKTTVMKAGNGHIYLSTSRRSTTIKNSTILVSSSSYGAFKNKVKKAFKKVRRHYGARKMNVSFDRASVSHDEIWALALAINNSLPKLKNKNLSIDSYIIGEHETTSVIAGELAKVSFQGASQYIKFTNRHVPHEVKIKQVNGSKLQEIGSYTPLIESDNVKYKLFLSIDSRSVPDDVPVVVYIHTSSFEAIVFYVAAGLTILFTTLILGLLLYCRESREVKAISPYLSIVIIIGCYLVSASAIVVTVQGQLVTDPNMIFILELTSIMMHDFGMYLIYATLALKLLRIMHIFTTWKVKCAILWKDISLALIAIGFSLLAFVNLIVLAPGFVTVYTNEENIIKEDITIVSQRSVKVQIHNHAISILIIVSKGIILFIILCLSTSTRRIDREQFKNTKKVNLLLLLLIFFEVMLNPAISIFYTHTSVALGDIVSVMLVHALLFLPNIASAFQSLHRRKKSVLKGSKYHNKVAKQKICSSSETLSTNVL